jgi:hypothetical protein
MRPANATRGKLLQPLLSVLQEPLVVLAKVLFCDLGLCEVYVVLHALLHSQGGLNADARLKEEQDKVKAVDFVLLKAGLSNQTLHGIRPDEGIIIEVQHLQVLHYLDLAALVEPVIVVENLRNDAFKAGGVSFDALGLELLVFLLDPFLLLQLLCIQRAQVLVLSIIRNEAIQHFELVLLNLLWRLFFALLFQPRVQMYLGAQECHCVLLGTQENKREFVLEQQEEVQVDVQLFKLPFVAVL